MYRWLRGAIAGHEPYASFAAELKKAREEARKVLVKAAPRHLARARYEQQATKDELVILAFQEVMRMIREGRIPHAVALRALEMATDELNDIVIEESVSYSPTLCKTFGVGGPDPDLDSEED